MLARATTAKSLALIWIVGSVLCLGVATASANTFGTRFLSSATIYGSRSSIAEPTAANQPPGDNRGYLHRVVLQNSLTKGQDTELIQAGWATIGANWSLDKCGTTNSSTYVFIEYTPNPNSYTCFYYDHVSTPNDWTFNVWNSTSSGWDMIWHNEHPTNEPFHPGFSQGYGGVGGEALLQNGATAVSHTCYGETTVWGREDTSTSDGSGANPITNNSNTSASETGGWTIGTVPSPLCDSVGQ